MSPRTKFRKLPRERYQRRIMTKWNELFAGVPQDHAGFAGVPERRQGFAGQPPELVLEADTLEKLRQENAALRSQLAQLQGLVDAKYLNADCAAHGCQFLAKDGEHASALNWVRSQRDVAEEKLKAADAARLACQELRDKAVEMNYKHEEHLQNLSQEYADLKALLHRTKQAVTTAEQDREQALKDLAQLRTTFRESLDRWNMNNGLRNEEIEALQAQIGPLREALQQILDKMDGWMVDESGIDVVIEDVGPFIMDTAEKALRAALQTTPPPQTVK